ncbi:hypothetical protein EJB05_14358, partial [Eragrostis curvula]
MQRARRVPAVREPARVGVEASAGAACSSRLAPWGRSNFGEAQRGQHAGERERATRARASTPEEAVAAVIPEEAAGVVEKRMDSSAENLTSCFNGELNCSVIHSTRQFKMKRHHSNARCGFTSSGHHITVPRRGGGSSVSQRHRCARSRRRAMVTASTSRAGKAQQCASAPHSLS